MLAVMRRCGFAAGLMVGVMLMATWSGVATASPKPLPLSARLIQRGEFAGFSPEAPIPFRTAKAFVDMNTGLTPAQAAAQIARLRREGFKAVLVEYLDRGPSRQSGVSWVMQLGSAASARAELAASLREYKAENVAHGGSVSAYSVGAIPGARGYHVAGGGQFDENILFADGPFLYLNGEAWSVGAKNAPTRAGLIAAVMKLYKRVHGHPAG
jgi:hypothetical protein